MPNDWDANVKLLYAVDSGTFHTIDDVAAGAAFDVIADVEIGKDLNDVVDKFDLRIGVRDLTQSTTVAVVDESDTLTPGPTPFYEQRTVHIPAGWTAEPGDVLQAVASYKVTAGANTDYSTAESNTFVVSAP